MPSIECVRCIGALGIGFGWGLRAQALGSCSKALNPSGLNPRA